MLLSFSTLACPNWSFPQIVGAAAAHGFNGIDPRGIGAEIDITRLPRFNEELPATLDLLARHGLRMPCLNTSVVLVTPAQERWEMMLEEARRYADLAQRAGSLYLRIFGGAVPKGVTREQATALARRHLRQLSKLCASHRCQVLIETHDEWAASERMLQLLEGFAPAEAAVLWDIEHACLRGEAPAETARALGSRVRHVHFKDVAIRQGKGVPRLLGQGELPLKEFLAALRGIDYDGWICLEVEKRWHAEDAPDPEESLPQFVKYMRENWGGREKK